MAKKKNSYEKKAKKKQVLEGLAAEQAKGNLKKTALETGRDILIGAVGGGLAGAVLGRSSFLVGIAVTGAGHYMGSNGAAAFGVGMMASGGYQAVAGAVNGTPQTGMEGLKERMGAFKEEFKRKLFLDKIPKGKKKTKEKPDEQGTNGVGEVQYFTHPSASELEGAEDHQNALDRIEKQVEESAKTFETKQHMEGTRYGYAETNMGDVSELNL